jgi:co-chaperonin GroES (HSP10)
MDKTIEILLNGSRVLVRRFPIETKTDSGLILPDYISTDKEAVGTGKRLDPFQKRGEVIAIGIDCSETFKSNFTIGDIVHFGPHAVEPVPLEKQTGVEDSTEYVLIDSYSIHWKELGSTATQSR